MKMKTLFGRRTRLLTVATGAIAVTTFVTASLSASAAPVQQLALPAASAPADHTISSTGLKSGQVKHVWLIILENKSYDATFTGLNQNSYLWKTLPSQGALLKNYFGTGHYSMDNYMSLISGQAPEQDTQSDCSVKNFDFGSNASIVSARNSKNYGQVASGQTPLNPAAQMHQTAPTAAPIRPMPQRCSISSTQLVRPGRPTRRTWVTRPAARTRSAADRARPPTTRPPTRP